MDRVSHSMDHQALEDVDDGDDGGDDDVPLKLHGKNLPLDDHGDDHVGRGRASYSVSVFLRMSHYQTCLLPEDPASNNSLFLDCQAHEGS